MESHLCLKKKKKLTAISTFFVFPCTNSTYERQDRQACKKTHTQSALLFVVVNLTTLLLLLLLVLPPMCHYTELPGCDAEKQKSHPGGCVSSPGWPIKRPGRALVSGTKMSKPCDSHEHGSTQRQQASRGRESGSSSNPACVQQPLVCVCYLQFLALSIWVVLAHLPVPSLVQWIYAHKGK